MTNRRAIGIVRVSRRNRNEGSGHSPEVQRRLISKFAESQDWELRDVLNENDLRDGNVSGGADLSDRPGFGPAVQRVERGDADLILTADFSRFFRDLDIQRAVIDRIEAGGGELWTVSNGRISHETADSELMANLQGSVTHYQKRYARDKSVLAVEIAIEQGKVPWCQTAPGYVRNDDSTLRPDPELKPIIVRAFKMRDGGATVAAVRAYLAEHGIQRSYHGTMHLLRDRIYVGEIHFKDRVNLQAHTGIVDRDLFERVQRVSLPRGRKPQSERLLARIGVLRCSGCGGRMVVGMQKQNGRMYPFYRCGHVREDCTQRVAVSATLVEDLVVDYVKRRLASIRGTASAAEGVTGSHADLERAQRALDAAITAFASLTAEPAAIAKLGELTEARNAARDAYEQTVTNSDATTIAVTVGDWDELTLEERRALIKAVIERVTVAPGRGPDRIAIKARAPTSRTR